MYIVKKKIKGKEYFYLRRSVREGDKVKSKNVAYLGKEKEVAEKRAEEIIKNLEKKVKKREDKEKEDGKIKLKGKMKKENEEKLEEIARIARKRGFFFQTARIYGGKAGFYTYGHLGKALKLDWENLWRKFFLQEENFYEIQSNNILPEKVFEASGHLKNFNDPLVECKKCHFRFRADQFLEDKGIEDTETLSIEKMSKIIKEKNFRCPKCGGNLGEVKWFNMMFPVPIGFNNEKGYLSPETAQASYLAFKEEFEATRNKLPLGLAIIDKAYRNEISPRQLFFRLREFTQAELQIFFDPEKINEHNNWNQVKEKKLRLKLAREKEIKEIRCEELNKKFGLPKFYLYYASKIQNFYLKILKIPLEKFRFRELSKEERAFYNKIHFDVELDLETMGGFKEVAGLHYRTDHDLKGHQKVSKENLEIYYENKRFIPHVLELSFGVDRNIWALLDVFYSVGKEGGIFKFPPKLAPYKLAVLPLIKNKKEFVELAREIYNQLKEEFSCFYDESGSIGRRYARQDEVGTPFCITIDGESLKRKDVTIRDRDTTEQIRVKIKDLKETLKKLLEKEIKFREAGKRISTRKK